MNTQADTEFAAIVMRWQCGTTLFTCAFCSCIYICNVTFYYNIEIT